MPQLNGGGGDDLGANDEMISFKDEGEQEEKISENVSAERDLDDVKSSLVNESESSSDSEVRDLRVRTSSGHEEQNNAVLLKNVPSLFFLCQQAERRPQTRADSESYDKARDYFSEGKAHRRSVRLAHFICACVLLILAWLHPCSTEKAARWWLFQEPSLPWLPVSNDPRPHQSVPSQRIPVPECENGKCALRVPPLVPIN